MKTNLELAAELDNYKEQFYSHDDTVSQYYYNPDSDSGGQIVENVYSAYDIQKALQETKGQNLAEILESNCNQYLYDIDEDDFLFVAESMLNHDFPYHEFLGETEFGSDEGIQILKNFAEKHEKKKTEQEIEI